MSDQELSAGSTARPELVFGLVGAIGTDLDSLCRSLTSALARVNYHTDVIRLSNGLRSLDRFAGLTVGGPLEKYYHDHIEAGDQLCQLTNAAHAMASLGVLSIRQRRKRITGSLETPASGRAYVIRSLKRYEEVALLRHVYGEQFIVISGYSPRAARARNLAQKIAHSHNSATPTEFFPQAETLLRRDEFESAKGIAFGQNIRGTFPEGDVFIDVSSAARCEAETERFVRLLFGHPFETPHANEYGMFVASGASRRSSDLARQVGAAVLDARGRVIATGTNEAPKGGGGTYGAGDVPDGRDFAIGHDSSFRRRSEMLGDVLQKLKDAGWLSDTKSAMDTHELVASALQPGHGGILRQAQLMDVIEFGRAVHAEMDAICDAALRGIPLAGATMLTTTFPCHNCARHIVASGISSVVYIEPYPKSLAEQMFRDSIVVDSESDTDPRVKFVPFVGVGPRLYMPLFTSTERKTDQGEAVTWQATTSSPKNLIGGITYLGLEEFAAANFGTALEQANIKEASLV